MVTANKGLSPPRLPDRGWGSPCRDPAPPGAAPHAGGSLGNTPAGVLEHMATTGVLCPLPSLLGSPSPLSTGNAAAATGTPPPQPPETTTSLPPRATHLMMMEDAEGRHRAQLGRWRCRRRW
jgi:hypothetical protein